MSEKAFRAIVTAPGQARLEPFNIPKPGPGQALIRTRKTLISPGTERAILLNMDGKNVRYPREVGYSHVGQVIELGCEGQGRGLREHSLVATRSRHASHALIEQGPVDLVWPGDRQEERATFVPLLATAVQAVRKTRIEIGETAAVLGLGLVGLLALQALKLAGALDIIAIDLDEGRLQRARTLGAETCLRADDEEAMRSFDKVIMDIPVVIEATGNPAAIELACEIASPEGRVALLGSTRGSAESFDFYRLVHKKALTLIGAHISSAHRGQSAPGWWTSRARA